VGFDAAYAGIIEVAVGSGQDEVAFSIIYCWQNTVQFIIEIVESSLKWWASFWLSCICLLGRVSNINHVHSK
jgi:hypothetical protein